MTLDASHAQDKQETTKMALQKAAATAATAALGTIALYYLVV